MPSTDRSRQIAHPARVSALLELAARWARRLELDPATARMVDTGWDFEVLTVAGTWCGPVPAGSSGAPEPDVAGTREWVFRFPRRPEVAELLEVEMRLLPVLGPALPVPLPRPSVVGLLDDGEHRFAGYPKLPGEPLRPDLATGGRGGLVISQLAGFLGTLHAFPAREAAACGVTAYTVETWRAHLSDVVERGTAILEPLVDDAPALAALARRWRALLGDDGRWPDRMRVVHGDLGVEHVLADHDRCVLSGVIDWTDARVADPAMDFADLVTGLGEEATARVLEAYADAADVPPDAAFRDRIQLYRELMPLHAALHGAETGQRAFLDAAVRDLAGGRAGEAAG